MNTRILIAVVVSIFVCQQVYAQDDPEQPEVTELEGTWETVAFVVGGENTEIDRKYLRVVGSSLYYREDDDEGWTHEGAFSLDPSAMPAEIDVEIESEIHLGIYELDGDSLRLCFIDPESGSRPDRFESTEDYPTYLSVLRRVEEDNE